MTVPDTTDFPGAGFPGADTEDPFGGFPTADAAVPPPRDGEPGTVEVPELPDLGAGEPVGGMRDLRLLADVQVELAVELGRVKLPLRDLLGLTPGSVVELDRAADAPVDVLVNGHLVARGEVVVVDGEFGVRITAVVTPGA